MCFTMRLDVIDVENEIAQAGLKVVEGQPRLTADALLWRRIAGERPQQQLLHGQKEPFNAPTAARLARDRVGQDHFQIGRHLLEVIRNQWFSQKSGSDSAVSSEFVIAGMIFHHSRVQSELLHKYIEQALVEV